MPGIRVCVEGGSARFGSGKGWEPKGLKPDGNTVLPGVFPAPPAGPRKNAPVLAWGAKASGSREEVFSENKRLTRVRGGGF